MQSDQALSNRLMRDMRVERTTMSDGRYLIYYRWPDDEAEPLDEPRVVRAEPRPAQQPWSPEAGPTDV